MRRTVYIIPGLGAKTDIYRHVRFPADYRIVPVEWLMPEPEETLSAYAGRLIETYAIEPDGILTGMSFGGIMINEIARQVPPAKLIFISTVKTHRAFPPWYAWGRKLKIYQWLPYDFIVEPLKTARYMPVKKLKKRLQLYEKYLSIRDTAYFQWAIERILYWKGEIPPYPYLHVHGSADRVFPVKYLKGNFITVPGDHLVMLTRPKLISRHVQAFLEASPETAYRK